MAKPLMYEKAFTLLTDAAIQHGIDRIVEDPISFLRQSLNVSQSQAWSHLKELERRGFVANCFEGVRIARARLIKNELPEKRFHEKDNMTRVLSTLWKYRHLSQSNPRKLIVHSSFFGKIQGDAEVLYNMLYESLQRFADNGWIEIEYSGVSRRPRIVYIVFKDSFPVYLVQ